MAQEDVNIVAELSLGGKQYSISHFSTEFNQDIDVKFEPQGEVTGGMLYLSFDQVPDTTMLQWAANPWAKKDGEIAFKNETGTPPLKISFTEAMCLNLSESIGEVNGSSFSLIISPKTVTINGVTLEKVWAGE